MNKIFFQIITLLTLSSLHAQNKVDYYEYWFDSDYAGKESTTIAPVQYYQLNTNVPTSGLSEGLHTIHLRFRDENTKFASVTSSFFLKQGSVAAATNEMAAYEYWFDNDYASAVSGVLSSNQYVSYTDLLATTGLSNGLHTVHIRFQDVTGKWSSVLSQFFLKQGTGIGSATPELVEYEYWFDSDYAGAQSTALAGNQYENVISNIDALALTNGLHTLHVRFKDAAGQWSSVLSQFFLKYETSASPLPQLVEYEYWFDNDYASRVNVAMSGAQYETILSDLDASATTIGLHTLHIRFKDASSKWSSVLSGFFIKDANATSPNSEVIGYRYWFDQNDAAMVTEVIPTPQQYVNVANDISMVTIPKGTHTIHFQFQDSQGMWSSVTNDTIYKNSLPIAEFSADATIFCDNGTVNFDNTSIDGEDFLWNFGDGNTSTDSLATHTYTSPGIYTVSLTATDPNVPIDSTTTITQMIHVYETPDPTITINGNDSICDGSTVVLSTAPVGSYLWSDNSTNPTLVVGTAGIYSVTVYNIDNPNCWASSSDVEITLMPLPDANFTFSNTDHLVTFTNTSPEGDNYLWEFGDGSNSTDLNPTHDYGVNGVYDSYLVAYNFCGSDTAFATIDLSYIGLSEGLISHEVLLYPNPTVDQVFISSDKLNYAPIIAVFDEHGKEMILEKNILVSEDRITLDFSEFPNGAYYVFLRNTEGWSAIEKVIVNR